MTSQNNHAPISVRIADWQDDMDRDALQQVRRRVFIEEQGVPESLEWDPEDAMATHLLAMNGQGQVIGTARFLPTGQIGRMAVLKTWRGRGVGGALLREALHMVPPHTTPFLHAQVEAIDFYARLGFAPQGPVFYDAEIPHRTMTRTRTRT